MAKEIQLTKGYVAIVDDDLYPLLARYKWRAHGPDRYGNVYASRTEKKRKVFMHRQILGISDEPTSVMCDHINGDTLDNRRSNLRLATGAQNSRNRKLQTNNSSGFKGVSWNEHSRRWRAQICVNRKRMVLGHFDDPKEAARAYNVAAKKHHREFACLNDVEE